MDGNLLDSVGPTYRRQPEGPPDRAVVRDRCPGVIGLHPAADGMLARLRLPGGRVRAAQLVAIADLAERGNGIVELTSRANVQVRGLGEQVSESVPAALAAVGLLPSRQHERIRNVLASPFAGRHPSARFEPDAVVERLDRGLCADPALASLPGRVLFVIEDGSGVLAGLAHDVALAPSPSGRLALLVGGLDSGLRAASGDAAADLALRAAHALLAALRGHPRAWAVHELPGGAAEVIAGLAGAGRVVPAVETVRWPPAPPAALVPGCTRQRDGRVAVTALAPLGRLSSIQLEALAEVAPEVRVSPWRTVSVLDVPDADAADLEQALADLGLVLEGDSGWSGLSACAGLGACGSARADVRAAAAARASARAPNAPAEHWSACGRRCGERPGQPVAVAALDEELAVRRGGTEVVVRDVQAALELLGSPQ